MVDVDGYRACGFAALTVLTRNHGVQPFKMGRTGQSPCSVLFGTFTVNLETMAQRYFDHLPIEMVFCQCYVANCQR